MVALVSARGSWRSAGRVDLENVRLTFLPTSVLELFAPVEQHNPVNVRYSVGPMTLDLVLGHAGLWSNSPTPFKILKRPIFGNCQSNSRALSQGSRLPPLQLDHARTTRR